MFTPVWEKCIVRDFTALIIVKKIAGYFVDFTYNVTPSLIEGPE